MVRMRMKERSSLGASPVETDIGPTSGEQPEQSLCGSLSRPGPRRRAVHGAFAGSTPSTFPGAFAGLRLHPDRFDWPIGSELVGRDFELIPSRLDCENVNPVPFNTQSHPRVR
jgi:hypothetical protein